MEHHFNVHLAKRIGVYGAIFIHHISYWILKNQSNGNNFINGRYWTYNSTEAFSKQFEYLSAQQIKRIIKKLEDDKIIASENHNKKKYDRTKWYTIIDKDIVRMYSIHCTKSTNGLYEIDQPIPDSKPDSKPNELFKEDFDWFLKHINSTFKSQRRTYNKDKLRARLKVFTSEEIKRAILNASKSPYHIENGYQYLTPEYFTRNDEHIDKWLNVAVEKFQEKKVVKELSYKEQLAQRRK